MPAIQAGRLREASSRTRPITASRRCISIMRRCSGGRGRRGRRRPRRGSRRTPCRAPRSAPRSGCASGLSITLVGCRVARSSLCSFVSRRSHSSISTVALGGVDAGADHLALRRRGPCRCAGRAPGPSRACRRRCGRCPSGSRTAARARPPRRRRGSACVPSALGLDLALEELDLAALALLGVAADHRLEALQVQPLGVAVAPPSARSSRRASRRARRGRSRARASRGRARRGRRA